MEIKKTKRLYTINQAAKERGVPAFALRGWIKAGEIKFIKSGKRYYLTLEALDRFIDGAGAAR